MTDDPFPAAEFDEWAPDYDSSVQSSSFPFTGYTNLLEEIVRQANPQPGAAVLDLGIGTGNLSELFARRGCRVWGMDFSAAMLQAAAVKLPGATLAQADLRDPLPAAFARRFDHLVSAYTFHHFPVEQKAAIARRLLDQHAQPDGVLLIGDIAFPSAAERDSLRAALGDDWEEEPFWLADETSAVFAGAGMTAQFTPISNCAGVFAITIVSPGINALR